MRKPGPSSLAHAGQKSLTLECHKSASDSALLLVVIMLYLRLQHKQINNSPDTFRVKLKNTGIISYISFL